MATPVEKPSLDIEPDLAIWIDVAPQRPAPPTAPDPVEHPPAALPRRVRSPRRAKATGSRHSGGVARSIRNVAATAAVLLGLPALFLFRADIVEAMPGTAVVYAALGLPVNLVGLKLAAIRSELVEENGTPVLEVSGDITNVSRTARAVPPLHLALEGESGERLYAWSVRAAEGDLETGRTVPFRVRLTAPPPASRRVEVTFKEVRAGKALAGLR